MSRLLSFSEISTALDCWARWDFRYGERLAGSSLKEKTSVPLLSGGKAWGAAVAAWHTHIDHLEAGQAAIQALDASLDEDADQQKEHGVYMKEQHDAMRLELLQMLADYIGLADPVQMEPVTERELLVPIPSRTGVRQSSTYKLLCYLDATSVEGGRVWIEEFKLRMRLTSVGLIVRSPQIRMYAWAYWKSTGVKPAGVFVNERLREVPKPPRVLASGKLSHAKNQMCSALGYEMACDEFGVEPNQETLAYLKARQWQQRVPVVFRDDELEETGRNLVTAGKLVHALESGEFEPLRNAKPSTCNGCPFREICDNPGDELVEMLFERRPAKKDRPPLVLKGAA